MATGRRTWQKAERGCGMINATKNHKPFHVELDSDTLRTINAMAKKDGTTPGELVRNVVAIKALKDKIGKDGVLEALSRKTMKPTTDHLRTFRTAIALPIESQVRLAIMCENSNMTPHGFLSMHLRCALLDAFDRMTFAEEMEGLERITATLKQREAAEKANAAPGNK